MRLLLYRQRGPSKLLVVGLLTPLTIDSLLALAGLGTSTAKEAKEYFANLEEHKKDFVWQGEQDGEAISMAFAKKRVEERKTWLREFQAGTFLDHTAGSISYHEFVHKELILFSRAGENESLSCSLLDTCPLPLVLSLSISLSPPPPPLQSHSPSMMLLKASS